MKVFIIGARGYIRNYGGWETYVKNLVDYSNNFDIEFHIWEVSSDKIQSKLPTKLNDKIYLHYIYTSLKGSAELPYVCIKATLEFIEYLNKNSIEEKTILYVLGYRVGHFYRLIKRRLKKRNVILINNPDGIEYKRAKWNFIIKKYWKSSERNMLIASDYVVCDSKGIIKHITKQYPKINKPTKYLSYGAKSVKTDFSFVDNYFQKYQLKEHDYYIVVGRFVPENNYYFIINEFLQSNSSKKLLIITNKSENKYFREIMDLINKSPQKENVILHDAIYDLSTISSLRKYAFAYIHGHSVGGTNPSLLEAMLYTDINILLNVDFNVEVGRDSALYFNLSKNNLANLINSIENNTTESERSTMGLNAKKIISNYYNWDKIAQDHFDYFKSLIGD